MSRKRNGHYTITSKELWLAVIFGVLGLAFNSSQWLRFMATLDNVSGLIVYYCILYGALYFLGRMGLTVFGIKIDKLSQTVGLLLLTSAFFICVNWTNPYVQYVTTGSLQGASTVFYNSEDGASWLLWSHFLPQVDVEVIRIFAFGLTPFLLALAGSYLINGKPRISK